MKDGGAEALSPSFISFKKNRRSPEIMFAFLLSIML